MWAQGNDKLWYFMCHLKMNFVDFEWFWIISNPRSTIMPTPDKEILLIYGRTPEIVVNYYWSWYVTIHISLPARLLLPFGASTGCGAALASADCCSLPWANPASDPKNSRWDVKYLQFANPCLTCHVDPCCIISCCGVWDSDFAATLPSTSHGSSSLPTWWCDSY